MNWRGVIAGGLAALMVVGLAGCGDDEPSASAADLTTGNVERVIGFDSAARQQTEGVAVNDDGDVFVSWSGLGQVLKVAEGSTKTEPFGSVTLGEGDFGVLGLTVADNGDVYGAVQSKTAGGAWRFDAADGRATRLEGSEKIGFANDLTFDDDGNLYVASSNEGMEVGAHVGAIWRVAPGGTAERWLAGPELGGTGTGGLPTAIGANGIDFHDGSLYVTNTEKAQILRVPVGDDGKPGELAVFAQDAALNAVDGIDIDDDGELVAAVIGQSKVVRVTKDGKVSEIAGDADGLDFPSSVRFGRHDSAGDLWVVNFAIAEVVGGKTVEGPALLRIPRKD